MIAESGIREADSAEGIDGLGPELPKRRLHVVPPPTPEPPPASREGLPFLTVVAIVVLAGLSHLTGAPIFVTIGLLATGMAGLLMHLLSLIHI